MDPNKWFQPSTPQQQGPANDMAQPAIHTSQAPVGGQKSTVAMFSQAQIVAPQTPTQPQTVAYGPQVPAAGGYPSTIYGTAQGIGAPQQQDAYVYSTTTPQVDEATIGATQHGAAVAFWLGIFLVAILTLVCVIVTTDHVSSTQKFSRLAILVVDIVLAVGMIMLGRRLKSLLADRLRAVSSLMLAVALCGAVVILSIAELTIELTVGKHAIVPLQGLLSLTAAIYLFIVRAHLKNLP